MKPPIRLENWSTILLPSADATGNESLRLCLSGDTGNHPTLGVGPVNTSPVEAQKDGFFITASGSVYELGKPAQAFVALYPEALAQLQAHVPVLDGEGRLAPRKEHSVHRDPPRSRRRGL